MVSSRCSCVRCSCHCCRYFASLCPMCRSIERSVGSLNSEREIQSSVLSQLSLAHKDPTKIVQQAIVHTSAEYDNADFHYAHCPLHSTRPTDPLSKADGILWADKIRYFYQAPIVRFYYYMVMLAGVSSLCSSPRFRYSSLLSLACSVLFFLSITSR